MPNHLSLTVRLNPFRPNAAANAPSDRREFYGRITLETNLLK